MALRCSAEARSYRAETTEAPQGWRSRWATSGSKAFTRPASGSAGLAGHSNLSALDPVSARCSAGERSVHSLTQQPDCSSSGVSMPLGEWALVACAYCNHC